MHERNPETLLQRQQAFGYTTEDLRLLMAPMFANGKEALGSMGDDAALACLSDRSRPLFHYFKQHFAQVTNPAIDSIRERPVMTLHSTLGYEKNLLEVTPEHARLLRLQHPVVTDAQLEAIRQANVEGLSVATLPMLYKVADGGAGLKAAVQALCEEASRAIAEGATIIVLSDREIDPDHAPIPSLLATGAVHHHLIRESSRTRCGLVVETGEAREVAHFALLIGYGAGAINPYLAFETGLALSEEGTYVSPDLDEETLVAHYLKSIDLGLLKIFAKMGISTLQSYRGAQIYEAIGLGDEIIDCAFAGTRSRVKGVGFDVIARETAMRHDMAFPGEEFQYQELDFGGLYQWRLRGEQHTFNPDAVSKLQHAVSQGSFETFKEFSAAANDDAVRMRTLRGLLDFKFDRDPVPLEEVEPVEAIVKRFCTGAMSYGSISKEAHETLAIAMNRIGGRSNTGEGGEDPKRWTPDPNGDSRRSAIKQVASGRFGVTSWYLVNSDEMQIKIAQGAKPGEGGELPGHKVDAMIAKTRYSTPGVGLISPPPHHDIYSIEDLAQLIHDLKNANRYGNREREAGLRERRGHDRGGCIEGQVGSRADLGPRRRHGRFRADIDQVRGLSVGDRSRRDAADARAERPARAHPRAGRRRLQDGARCRDRRAARRRRVRLRDRAARGDGLHPDAGVSPEHLPGRHRDPASRGTARALHRRGPITSRVSSRIVAREVREYMSELGFRTFDEMIGQTQKLKMRDGITHWKAKSIDLTDLFHRADVDHDIRHTGTQDHGSTRRWINKLLELAARRSSAARRSRSICRSRTSTARSARSSAPRSVAEVRARRSARRHHQDPLHGFGGAEPRRLAAEGRHDHRRRRRERLHRQGAVGRQGHRARARAARPSTRARTSSRATSSSTVRPVARRTSTGWSGSASACATAARTQSSKASATTAAST